MELEGGRRAVPSEAVGRLVDAVAVEQQDPVGVLGRRGRHREIAEGESGPVGDGEGRRDVGRRAHAEPRATDVL